VHARAHTHTHATQLSLQGSADNFLSELMPKNLEAAATEAGYPMTLRMHEGYDHSYFFMSTFIDEHIIFHATELNRS
jgi:S-formylglutathione hydrolase